VQGEPGAAARAAMLARLAGGLAVMSRLSLTHWALAILEHWLCEEDKLYRWLISERGQRLYRPSGS